MIKLHTYLTFNGNCQEAFDFYQHVFQGKIISKSFFGEMPDTENFEVPDSQTDRIMHISLGIGEEAMLMGSDTIEGQGPPLVIGNHYSISIQLSDRNRADHIFSNLSRSGQVVMPMAETFWGSYFGMLVDQYGIRWMINCDTDQ